MAYLFAQTMANGWRRTLPAALAPLLSDGPIVLLMVLILTNLPATVLVIIQLLGGCFILYLAWRAFLTFRQPVEAFDLSSDDEARPQSLIEASIMNLLNPNPYIFWGAVGAPLLVTGWQRSPSYSVGFLIAFYVALLSVNVALIVIFGVARGLGSKVVKWLSGVAALALFGFGTLQLITGIQRLAGV